MRLERDSHTGLHFLVLSIPLPPRSSSSDTADLPHFCAADALSRQILSWLTVSILAKCQGRGHICLSLSAACPRLLGSTLYPGAAFKRPNAPERLFVNTCSEETSSCCLAFSGIVFDVAFLSAVSSVKAMFSYKVLLRRVCYHCLVLGVFVDYSFFTPDDKMFSFRQSHI